MLQEVKNNAAVQGNKGLLFGWEARAWPRTVLIYGLVLTIRVAPDDSEMSTLRCGLHRGHYGDRDIGLNRGRNSDLVDLELHLFIGFRLSPIFAQGKGGEHPKAPK